MSVCSVLCDHEIRGNDDTKDLKKSLKAFYLEQYKPTMVTCSLGFTNQTQLLQYVAKDVVKDYENNIKLHFAQHLRRFLGMLYEKKNVLIKEEKCMRKSKSLGISFFERRKHPVSVLKQRRRTTPLWNWWSI